MKKSYLTIIICFISLLINAQNNDYNDEEWIVKVRPVKSIENSEFCKKANKTQDAVVAEFDVVNEIDIEKFGNKIYAIAICRENPSDGYRDSDKIWDLTISEIQYYCWNIKIYKQELLDLNRNKLKFWVRELSRKVATNCEALKQR